MGHTTELLILEFANKFAKIPMVKTLLKPIYYPFKKKLQNKRQKLFQKNALNVIALFDKCCEENSINYTLAFGTLLGAIREKGFIKHDFDIDVCIWNSEYSDKIPEALKQFGFKLIHTFLVDNGNLGREETYFLDGVSIDIFYFYDPIDQYPYCCDFLMCGGSPTFRKSMELYGKVCPRRIELPMCREREKVQFETLKLYVPTNAKELLIFRYGEDYMIPNANWDIKSYDTHIVEWDEQKGVFIDFEK